MREEINGIEIGKDFNQYFSRNSTALGSVCEAINNFAIIFAFWSSWIILALTKIKFQMEFLSIRSKIGVTL
jgi:uncharacterized membrane protein AbrB (regulator of aidB expression)